MINKNITPLSEIAYLNTGLLLLSEFDRGVRVDIHECALTDIQGMIFHLGGTIDLHNQDIPGLDHLIFATFKVTINRMELKCYTNLTAVAYNLQLSAFGSDVFVFEKGTEVTIIDNSYFVF